MKANLSEVGRVAISTQGHDAGRWYCVVAIAEDGCLLCADGTLRKLDQPKKKNAMHLNPLPFQIDCKGCGYSGGPFTDGDLAKILRGFKQQYATQTEWPQWKPKPFIKVEQKEECALVQK